MSLYYETAPFLSLSGQVGGSLKSRIFSAGPTKSSTIQIFALASEASKWSPILSEVIEKAQLLQNERKASRNALTPNIALPLVHDLLLTKRGISAPANHPLRLVVEKHKARLSAELTRSRLKRGFASLELLRAHIKARPTNDEADGRTSAHSVSPDNVAPQQHWPQPRWARVNVLKTDLAEQLKTTFVDFSKVETLEEVLTQPKFPQSSKLLHVDRHVPNLLALSPGTELAKIPAYLDGCIILQDKASCFPAYLLNPGVEEICLDACAAPGNKTTHLAAILDEKSKQVSKPVPVVHASERESKRASTLDIMVQKAGASSHVRVHRQDFLRFDSTKPPCSGIGALLLDPSCSGSGIVSRDETFSVVLPRKKTDLPIESQTKKKKRKRTTEELVAEIPETQEEMPIPADEPTDKLALRLAALSEFQLRLLLHAFHFPKARKITYSTCSIHAAENEHVVVKALLQSLVEGLGWRILPRAEQVEGMRAWKMRGDPEACRQAYINQDGLDSGLVAEACIRCAKGTKEGTQGFFVAAFVREGLDSLSVEHSSHLGGEEEEWQGFEDS